MQLIGGNWIGVWRKETITGSSEKEGIVLDAQSPLENDKDQSFELIERPKEGFNSIFNENQQKYLHSAKGSQTSLNSEASSQDGLENTIEKSKRLFAILVSQYKSKQMTDFKTVAASLSSNGTCQWMMPNEFYNFLEEAYFPSFPLKKQNRSSKLFCKNVGQASLKIQDEVSKRHFHDLAHLVVVGWTDSLLKIVLFIEILLIQNDWDAIRHKYCILELILAISSILGAKMGDFEGAHEDNLVRRASVIAGMVIWDLSGEFKVFLKYFQSLREKLGSKFIRLETKEGILHSVCCALGLGQMMPLKEFQRLIENAFELPSSGEGKKMEEDENSSQNVRDFVELVIRGKGLLENKHKKSAL